MDVQIFEYVNLVASVIGVVLSGLLAFVTYKAVVVANRTAASSEELARSAERQRLDEKAPVVVPIPGPISEAFGTDPMLAGAKELPAVRTFGSTDEVWYQFDLLLRNEGELSALVRLEDDWLVLGGLKKPADALLDRERFCKPVETCGSRLLPAGRDMIVRLSFGQTVAKWIEGSGDAAGGGVASWEVQVASPVSKSVTDTIEIVLSGNPFESTSAMPERYNIKLPPPDKTVEFVHLDTDSKRRYPPD